MMQCSIRRQQQFHWMRTCDLFERCHNPCLLRSEEIKSLTPRTHSRQCDTHLRRRTHRNRKPLCTTRTEQRHLAEQRMFHLLLHLLHIKKPAFEVRAQNQCILCLTASNNITAAAADTLSDSMEPISGMAS